LSNFTARDIADYYNQTMHHYQRWWHLNDNLAVHYGFWEPKTKSFQQALENTNVYLLEIAEVQQGERILDAGCGVGGSSFFLAKEKNAKVTGITLSEKQIDFANKKLKEFELSELVDFKLGDYTDTDFKDETFDLIWAIESITTAPDKVKFAQEAYRILKPGGRLVIADYFKNDEVGTDKNGLLESWRKNWSMSPFLTLFEYKQCFESTGFILSKQNDVTDLIYKTSKKLYQISLIGAIPSRIYNFFYLPSRFTRHHYKSGIYQYKALKQGLWKYHTLVFQKNLNHKN
jgi:cyclopropane fatty-acyl-phospholipid synthase-like methyltransferase